MRRWNTEIEAQRKAEIARTARPNGTSESQFTSLRGVQMDNPYYQEEADEDEYKSSMSAMHKGEVPMTSEFVMSRNASSTSLRSRSATGGSGGSISTHGSMGRPPARFPVPDLSSLPPLNTQISTVQSPSDRAMNSYFSPVETPMSASARSSSQSTFAGYHRFGTPTNAWPHSEESNRNTAPAMSRNMTGAGSNGNPYLMNRGGPGQRPSIHPSATTQTAQQLGMGLNRMRSASSPDIHQNQPPNRRYANGQVMPNGELVPTVPPIPAHVAGRVAPVNRSQNNSPINLPTRANAGSPASQQQHGLSSGSRPQMTNYHTYDATGANHGVPRQYNSSSTALSISSAERTLSPPTPSSDDEPFMPSQLKAKVCFDNNYITLVIASNIQFRSLTDRIDAKLARFTNHSIGSGSVRLRYQDEDGDFIWIDSDEAVQDTFLDWRETHADKIAAGQVGEILLFCHSVAGEAIAA